MNSDEILQNKIESGSKMHGTDADAYEIVFNSLKKEPQLNLSSDFAFKVSSIATPKKSFDWDKFMFVSAGIGFIGALIFSIMKVKPTFSFGVFTFFSSYAGLLVFAVIFILLLNWLDKKLLRQSHS